MSKDNLKLLNLDKGASKEEIYESYIRLHKKYALEKNDIKLAELDHAYGDLLTTGRSKPVKPNQFSISTKAFILIFVMALLTISGLLYYKLIKDSPQKENAVLQDNSDSSEFSEESLKPLVKVGDNQGTPNSFIESESTEAMNITSTADPKLQISNKGKIEIVESYIKLLKKDSNAQSKVMSCYFKYQNLKEPGIPCVYMDAAAEYALNTPGKSSSFYFSTDAVNERARLHLYLANNISESVAREHLKQVRFDVSQIVTDIVLNNAQRIGSNQERSRPEPDTYVEHTTEEKSVDDAVRAAQMAAYPAIQH